MGCEIASRVNTATYWPNYRLTAAEGLHASITLLHIKIGGLEIALTLSYFPESDKKKFSLYLKKLMIE